MADFYWELVQHDGTRTEIPPEAVAVVKRRMDNGDPIHTNSMSIPVNQIRFFRQTDKKYGQQPLLEAAAQAFNEPMYNSDGSIVAKWVKKSVTQREFQKTYSATPAYKSLGEEGGRVVVAFRLPVHEIDTARLDYCTDEEVQQLQH